MEPIIIAGQVLSVLAMVCNVLSYQQKRQSTLLLCQMMGCALFSASYFMLGATMGAIINIISVLRAIAFSFPDKLRTSHPAWVIGLSASYIVMYILGFTVFGIELSVTSLIIEFLPVFAMTMLSIGFRSQSAKTVRRFGLIASPAWLIYNAFYMSIGALIGEVFNLVSIGVGIARHDNGAEREKSEDTEK